MRIKNLKRQWGAKIVKPNDRNNWLEEDHDLADEFQDVASAWQKEKREAPNLQGALDRKIRKFAYAHIEDDLQHNWLFGQGPRLATAVTLFFAIGVYFVFSVPEGRPPEIERNVDPTVERRQSATRLANQREADLNLAREAWEKTRWEQTQKATASSWVKLSLVVGDQGVIEKIDIVESCAKRNGRCEEDSDLNTYAIEMVKRKSFEPGVHEELILSNGQDQPN